MGKNLYIIFIGIVLLLVIIGGAYFISNNDNNSSNTNSNSNQNSNSNTVNIENMTFSKSTLTVKIGTTVTWTNNDSFAHTVTSDTGVFNSSSLSKGGTFQYTFNTAGTFPYHCSIHPNMIAEIVVE
jgi:plastocyanin